VSTVETVKCSPLYTSTHCLEILFRQHESPAYSFGSHGQKVPMATLFSSALFLLVHIIMCGVYRRVNIRIDLQGVISERQKLV
jgi:hypothetical protein